MTKENTEIKAFKEIYNEQIKDLQDVISSLNQEIGRLQSQLHYTIAINNSEDKLVTIVSTIRSLYKFAKENEKMGINLMEAPFYMRLEEALCYGIELACYIDFSDNFEEYDRITRSVPLDEVLIELSKYKFRKE